MKWNVTIGDQRKWFAWYPVELESGEWVWLGYVYRRWCCTYGGGYWAYKNAPKEYK